MRQDGHTQTTVTVELVMLIEDLNVHGHEVNGFFKNYFQGF